METERVPGQYETVSESIGIRLGNRSGEDMVGRIGIDLADRSCPQIGDVQPSVDAGDEVEAPEGELRAGDEGDHAEVDRGHQTCWDDLDNNPYLARQLSVLVTGNKIYMVGCRITSVMVAQDVQNGAQSFRQVRALGRR